MEELLILSHHRKTTWKRCKLKHYIHYELKLQHIKSEDIDLIFGTAIHKFLEAYYQSNRKATVEELTDVFNSYMRLESDIMSFSHQLDVWTRIGHTIIQNYWKLTQSEQFGIVYVEKPFFLSIDSNGNILSDDEIHKDAYFIIAGKVDLIAQSGDDIYFIDHKTTKQTNEKFTQQFQIDEQLLDYSIYGRWLYGDSYKGVMVNGINKDLKSTEPSVFRDWFTFTDIDIDNAIQSFLSTAQEYYILNQAPHLAVQRNQQFDCNRCNDLDYSLAFRKGLDKDRILEIYYEKIEEMDWEI